MVPRRFLLGHGRFFGFFGFVRPFPLDGVVAQNGEKITEALSTICRPFAEKADRLPDLENKAHVSGLGG